MDPAERLVLLDAEGIDAVVLYTTDRTALGGRARGPRAEPGVHPGLQPVDLRVLRRQRPTRADGPPVARRSGGGRRGAGAGGRRRGQRRVRGPFTHDGRPLGHPDNDPVFAAAARPRRPVRHPPDVRAAVDQGHPHGRRGRTCGSCASSRRSRRRTACASSSRPCSTTACSTGSPRSRCWCWSPAAGGSATGSTGIDAVYGHTFIGTRVPLEQGKPSDYFRERVWISCDPDERMIPALAERYGATGSCGHPTSRTPTTRRSTSPTSRSWPRRSRDADRAAFLGDNARALFRIDA